MTDYYRVLGLDPQAEEKEIRKAYRSLAKQYHPDAHPGDARCEERFREISEAYQILGDTERRRQYDEARRAEQRKAPRRGAGEGRKAGTSGGGTGTVPPMSEFERFFGFRPRQGMETYRDKKSGSQTAEGAAKPEEKFASFFQHIR